ncbi:type I glyceraldehyde-3-phosphate dehydrogenase, partial [Patescibacteria group bacterium]|nr:type I glyceraldehyde-3-phosphate dehydrogenase [Patescibacteria group bacterium]
KEASEGVYKNILKYETNPIVSSDIINSPYSSIFDSLLTEQSDDLIKIVSWYDNEFGYACRLAEMAEFIGKKL